MALDFQQLANAGALLNNLSTIGNPSFNGFQPKREIITVNGFQEAKDFKLNKGEQIALIDSNEDILYIKEADDCGKYSLRVYECKEITDDFNKSISEPSGISREEFEKLSADVAEVKKLLSKKGKNSNDASEQFI